MQKTMERWITWLKDLGEKGHVKDKGEPLDQGGKVLRTSDGTVTDGPYAEKDLVGGFSLIRAKDLAAAGELARGCPIFLSGGLVEVRPVLQMNM
jgi:hypothetical protein